MSIPRSALVLQHSTQCPRALFAYSASACLSEAVCLLLEVILDNDQSDKHLRSKGQLSDSRTISSRCLSWLIGHGTLAWDSPVPPAVAHQPHSCSSCLQLISVKNVLTIHHFARTPSSLLSLWFSSSMWLVKFLPPLPYFPITLHTGPMLQSHRNTHHP